MKYTRPLPPVWNWSKVVIDSDKDMQARNLSNLNQLNAQKVVSSVLDASGGSVTADTVNANSGTIQNLTVPLITGIDNKISFNNHELQDISELYLNGRIKQFAYEQTDTVIHSISGWTTQGSLVTVASTTITYLYPSPSDVKIELSGNQSGSADEDSYVYVYVNGEQRLSITVPKGGSNSVVNTLTLYTDDLIQLKVTHPYKFYNTTGTLKFYGNETPPWTTEDLYELFHCEIIQPIEFG